MNKCHFVGRVGKDPESLGSGGIRFSLATEDYNPSSQSRETTWIPLVAFGKQAETIEKYAGKGRMLAVVGRYATREKDGKYYHNFVVQDFELLPDGKGGQRQDNSVDDVGIW